MSKQKSNTSEAMVKFLKERVESNQGISLQKLTGHLSQLPSDLRTKYGCSVKSLKVFLQQYPKVFVIRNQSNVYVRTKKKPSLSGSIESDDTSMSDRGTDESPEQVEEITSLHNAKGKVYRIFNVYGFISVTHPIQTSVYFDVQAFENGEHSNLPASGLQIGDGVVIDAKAGPKECEAKFRASRVVRTKNATALSSSTSSSPTPHVLGVCGSSKQLMEYSGLIETVKSMYGFIKFGRNLRERAFFHLNNVDKPQGRIIKNLPDVLTVDDKVHFKAKPSKKPSDKVKWEATVVYIPHFSRKQMFDDSDDESGNEVFMSDDESDFVDMLHDDDEGHGDDNEAPPAGYTDWGTGSTWEIAEAPPPMVNKSTGGMSAAGSWNCLRKRSGEKGSFFPKTEMVGEIRFGSSVALASADVTYRGKELVDNLLWEIPDNQEVNFDAVQSAEGTWIATLVWTEERPPLKPCVEDSEAVFRGKFAALAHKTSCSPRDSDGGRPESSLDGHCEAASGAISPLSRTSQPSVSVNLDACGTVILAMECVINCEVEEPGRPGRPRVVEVTAFYKDGKIYPDDLNKVLKVGDQVTLDYMVATLGDGEEVHCDLAWQGQRPKGAKQLSPEDFCEKLRINTSTLGGISCFNDFELEM